jgi:hypothetical protein
MTLPSPTFAVVIAMQLVMRARALQRQAGVCW